MLSRVADSIYWMGRYVERADNLARLLISTQHILLDAGAEAADESQFWGPLLATTGDDELYAARHPVIEGSTVADFLTLAADNPNSILNCIRGARENARTVRDQIPDELWECLNDVRLFIESPESRRMHDSHEADFYERVLRASYQFQGIASSTIPRGDIWHFLQMGTCIERADKITRLIDTCSQLSLDKPPHPQSRPLRWAALLRSCSAWQAFQSRSSKLDPPVIIEYLLLDPIFPRSFASCVAELHEALQALCGPGRLDEMKEPVRLSGRLAADIRYVTVGEVLGSGLHDFLDGLQVRLNEIGHAIFETFVLYADLLPVAAESLPAGISLGAWHSADSADMQMQQQQQQ